MYHQQSIELWIYTELFTISDLHEDNHPQLFLHLYALATLVDFPQFRDIHHLIPQVLGMTAKLDFRQIEDSDKWEIYVKYRQIVSRFLIGPRCWIPPREDRHNFFFSAWSRGGQENYVNLAKYLLRYMSKSL